MRADKPNPAHFMKINALVPPQLTLGGGGGGRQSGRGMKLTTHFHRVLIFGISGAIHRAKWHSPATLTEVFPCSFLSCMANARVYIAKTGHGPHFSLLVNCVVLCIVLRR